MEKPKEVWEGCPHCGNMTGFVFGTCIECGFNRIDGRFEHVRVRVDDLPWGDRAWMIDEHAKRTLNRNRPSRWS